MDYRGTALADDGLIITAAVEVLGNGIYLHHLPGRLTAGEAYQLGMMLVGAAREVNPNIEREMGR